MFFQASKKVEKGKKKSNLELFKEELKQYGNYYLFLSFIWQSISGHVLITVISVVQDTGREGGEAQDERAGQPIRGPQQHGWETLL